MKPSRTYLKDATRSSLSHDELPTEKGEQVAQAAEYDEEQIRNKEEDIEDEPAPADFPA